MSDEVYFWAIHVAPEGYRCSRYISTAYRVPKGGWGATKTKAGGSHAFFRDIETAREFCRELSLSCYPRRKSDPPDIVETWV